jgi:leucyl-tRNA---protein transferase
MAHTHDASSVFPPPLPLPIHVPLVTSPEHPCPYLPGRIDQFQAFHAGRMPPDLYHRFMDAGFRRSGGMIYRPICPACRACIPIRVPVAQFKPSKSQRRCWRRNQDLTVQSARPIPSDEKLDLFRRYSRARHGEKKEFFDPDEFRAFLYDSPVDTVEFAYRDPTARLLAVGICDVSSNALSTVYFFFDPAEKRRGLGTFGALWEIDFARSRGISYYYLGYWVGGCAGMQYKADFKPNEFLGPDGLWRSGDPARVG